MSNHAAPSAPLPEGWATILETIDAHLHEAVSAADARTAGLSPSGADAASESLKREWADLAERLRSLQERTVRAQTLADDEDLTLAVDENALRRRLADAESLRQRLAAWAARAIR